MTAPEAPNGHHGHERAIQVGDEVKRERFHPMDPSQSASKSAPRLVDLLNGLQNARRASSPREVAERVLETLTSAGDHPVGVAYLLMPEGYLAPVASKGDPVDRFRDFREPKWVEATERLEGFQDPLKVSGPDPDLPPIVEYVWGSLLRRLGEDHREEAVGTVFPLQRQTRSFMGFIVVARPGGRPGVEDLPPEDLAGLRHHVCSVTEAALLRKARAEARQDLEAQVEDAVAELQRSNEDLERFAHIASHDLREPLRMVTQYLQLLERRAEGKLTEDESEFLHYAVDGAQRMDTLLRALLEYSRVGTRGERFTEVDLQEAVEDALANLSSLLEDRTPEITVEPLPVVKGDRDQLVQVMQNLIANAIKYSEDRPRITVEAGCRGQRWHITVRDEGVGVPEGQRERVFNMFHRVDPESTEGTGVGLAVVQRIMERHDGRVWMEDSPSGGTEVHLTLPMSSAMSEEEFQELCIANG